MVAMAVLQSAILTPCIRYLYDPSGKFIAYRRRSIQQSRRNGELRILVCVHEEENVPTIINILEASNPTRDSPIALYVLDLVELVGQALPLLISHKPNKPLPKSSRISRIVGAFRKYEFANLGLVALQCFTSIAPYETIHEDICSMALTKSTSLLIIPFNPSSPSSIRRSNRKVIDKSPCSLGILVDRGGMLLGNKSRGLTDSWFTFQVCVIFIGGPDDCEALFYGARMADHPHVRLTVIRIFHTGEHDPRFGLSRDEKLDLNALSELRVMAMDNSRIEFIEEGVAEASGTTQVLKALTRQAAYDLILVGRRHSEETPVLRGLGEWSEIDELGTVGEIMSSPDFGGNASVLVMQQQVSALDDVVFQNSLHFSTNSAAVVQHYSDGLAAKNSDSSSSSSSSRDLEKCNSKNKLMAYAV